VQTELQSLETVKPADATLELTSEEVTEPAEMEKKLEVEAQQ